MSRSSRTRLLSIRLCILSRSSGEISAPGDAAGTDRRVLTARFLSPSASKSYVGAGGKDVHRTPVAVEGGVEDRLIVSAQRDNGREGESIIELAHHLRAVAERAVADEKAGAALLEVGAVVR